MTGTERGAYVLLPEQVVEVTIGLFDKAPAPGQYPPVLAAAIVTALEVEGYAVVDKHDRRRPGVLSFRGAPVGAVQGGCLCFEGTRIPVDIILGFIRAGDNDETILYHYPSLTQADLDAARWFAGKWQIRRRWLTAARDDSPSKIEKSQ